MKVLLSPGETLDVEMEDTDGGFSIHFDSKHKNALTVESDLPDDSGREGIIYWESFIVTRDRKEADYQVHLEDKCSGDDNCPYCVSEAK